MRGLMAPWLTEIPTPGIGCLRFNGEGMPVETLVELAAYRELILRVAKAPFRTAQPARRS